MAATHPIDDPVLPGELLRELSVHRQAISEGEVAELELVHAWAVSHPATGELAGEQGILTKDEFPGGEGTPGVAAFTAEPLAGALRISPYAAQALLADTLDLLHRLPRLWDQVQLLSVPVWKARRIAKATRDLPLEAVLWVDRQLIGSAGSIGSAALDRLTALAIARVDPDGAKDLETAERAKWGVDLEHPRGWAGTSELTAIGDTVALGEVMARVDVDAAELADAGDTDPVGARRVKALVSLARNGADQLALGFAAEDVASADTKSGSSIPRPALKLYVHASLADLVTLAAGHRTAQDGATADAVAEVERLGPITSDLLKRWLDQAHGRCRVTVTPVLDLAEGAWSPRHDPPPRMRKQVLLRHRGCVFPFCGHDARSADLDHVEPWDPLDPSGPGGTRLDNFAPLCRRHHRAKTEGRWCYGVMGGSVDEADLSPETGTRPAHPPDHLWTGPHGQTYLVTQGRTLPLGEP